MIQFVCDGCGKVKKPADNWILGRAVETVGVAVVQREVDILSAWNDTDAVYSFAVHFCSEKCKEKYVTDLMKKEAS